MQVIGLRSQRISVRGTQVPHVLLGGLGITSEKPEEESVIWVVFAALSYLEHRGFRDSLKISLERYQLV